MTLLRAVLTIVILLQLFFEIFSASITSLALFGIFLSLIYIFLVDGLLVIYPYRKKKEIEQEKVFVIGLSRTGTTSITEALNIININTFPIIM